MIGILNALGRFGLALAVAVGAISRVLGAPARRATRVAVERQPTPEPMRRRSGGRRRLAVVATAGATALVVAAVAAVAFWTTSGSGTASASAGNLTAATISGSTTTGSVTVTWDTQAAMTPSSQSSAITYTVERKLGSGSFSPAGGSCSGSKPYNTASCTDTLTVGGSYTYRVVAHYSTSWTAVSNEVTVSVTVDNTPPNVTAVDRADGNPTNAASVSWDVTFDEPVTGVNAADFVLVGAGASGASISSVTGSGDSWTVAVSTGADGTLGLNLDDDDSIQDAGGNKLGGTGVDNGDFTGETYSVDRSAPAVSSINRVGSTPTNATSVQWIVTLSEGVSGVDATDFTLVQAGGVTGATITGVTGTGPYTVTANTGSNSGTLGLNLVDNDSIVDGVGNKLGGTGAGNGNFTGQVYAIDKLAPTVSTINRTGTTPTNATSLQWTVTFSEIVTGVDATDFALVQAGGVTGATITGVTGTGPYTVTANTGSNSGTLGLNLVDNGSIGDAAGNDLGGPGAGNGNFTGQVYALDKTPPTVSSINRVSASPTNASSVQWTVVFSETVTGVGTADFALVQAGGVSGATVTGVTGTGPYTVTASTGSGSGTLGLNLADDDSIQDGVGNALGGAGATNGDFMGQVFTIDKTPPYVTSINRASADPTNATSVQWTVNFSETVTGVTTNDFSLVRTGALTGGSVTGVTGSGSGPYTVTATTGSGSGTLGLNLVDDNTIVDALSNPLGDSAGGTNGNFTGQVYTIDKTPPYVTSIDRANPDPTNSASVQWTVSFSESVTGVDTTDFTLQRSGGLTGGSVTGVTGAGNGPYVVTATTGSNSGTLGLNLTDNNSIIDALGNQLGNSIGGANGAFTGQVYTVDKTGPTVSSINRAGTTPTNAASVQWTVTFNEAVTGVDTADFALVQAAGVTGASITSVTGTGPYTLTATTGSNSGTLGLNLVDDDSISDTLGNKLGGTGLGNGNFTGQIYTIDKSTPSVSSVTLTDGPGTAGRLDDGDSIVIVFSEQMAVSSLCSTWTGDTTNQSVNANGATTVTLVDGGVGNDSVTVSSSTCTFNFGSIALASTAYVTGGTRTYNGNGSSNSTIAWNASSRTLTILVGDNGTGGTIGTVPGATIATYNPSAAITDSAGNGGIASKTTANAVQF